MNKWPFSVIPGAYSYDEDTDELMFVQYVDRQRYFDGDDYAWEEIPHIVEITDPKEKAKIIKQLGI